jgi:hypothetical protein
MMGESGGIEIGKSFLQTQEVTSDNIYEPIGHFDSTGWNDTLPSKDTIWTVRGTVIGCPNVVNWVKKHLDTHVIGRYPHHCGYNRNSCIFDGTLVNSLSHFLGKGRILGSVSCTCAEPRTGTMTMKVYIGRIELPL